MKIEHEFCDTKDSKWGLGLRSSLTRKIARLEILLLIAAIAFLYLWLIGTAAEFQNLHHHYQSNTMKKRRVLSLVFLGQQIIEHQIQLLQQLNFTTLLQTLHLSETTFYAEHAKEIFVGIP